MLQQPELEKGKFTHYPTQNPNAANPVSLCLSTSRLRSVIQSLSSALELTQSQALFMLASDLNLLDTPPLRVRQYAEALTQLFQVSGADTEVASGPARRARCFVILATASTDAECTMGSQRISLLPALNHPAAGWWP